MRIKWSVRRRLWRLCQVGRSTPVWKGHQLQSRVAPMVSEVYDPSIYFCTKTTLSPLNPLQRLLPLAAATSIACNLTVSRPVEGTPLEDDGVQTNNGTRDSDIVDTSDIAHPAAVDADGDGYAADVDCDDADPSTFPGAAEVCGDGVITDCYLTEFEARQLCRVIGTDRAVAEWRPTPGEDDGAIGRLVGDTNGDGFEELAFGVPDLAAGGPDSGGILLFPRLFDGGWIDEPDVLTVGGVLSYDTVGSGLESLGDIDGDGYDDVVVGAPDDEYGEPTGTPALYILHGPLTGSSISTATEYVHSPLSSECLGAFIEPIEPEINAGIHAIATSGNGRSTPENP